MIPYVLTVMSLLAALLGLGIVLYFRDRQLNRLHENKLTLEVLAKAKATAELVMELDKLVREELDKHTKASTQTLENYRVTLVEVLKDMREIVKETEFERKRVAANAAATLLKPSGSRQGRLPQP